ncbi:hypothetical protein EUX98_g6585 [Antrodiella citrinella]|uniref:DUF6534 domain-containing protein n=1 Tax=Antrodiella citrinella TaxID=2447956 RepID=A0A4S4MNW7_9APHY|nr:hypothetical protein EUX98_g6585 [Antrodiella citrinella]
MTVIYVATVWAGGSALCHVVITTSMFFYLLKVKISSTAKRTSSLITRLIKLTVKTGLIWADVNMVALILFLSSRSTPPVHRAVCHNQQTVLELRGRGAQLSLPNHWRTQYGGC